MRTTTVIVAVVAVLCGHLAAQEKKPVPKDSVRVSIPGCTKGYIFTAGRRTADEPGTVSVPEGMHFRMNAPKKLIAEIKAQGSMIRSPASRGASSSRMVSPSVVAFGLRGRAAGGGTGGGRRQDRHRRRGLASSTMPFTIFPLS
jgi:hypothetical protein